MHPITEKILLTIIVLSLAVGIVLAVLALFDCYYNYTKVSKVDIQPGQHWIYDPEPSDDGSPWVKKYQRGGTLIEVLDIKKGWVRYSIGRAFPDERMELKYFIEIYKKVEEETK